jgi:hypothetical protein
MNSKILKCIEEKLQEAFNIDKYEYVKHTIKTDARFDDFPWTPARKKKFIQKLESTFGVPVELDGTIGDLVERTDVRYLAWFFGEVWKPRTSSINGLDIVLQKKFAVLIPKRYWMWAVVITHLKGVFLTWWELILIITVLISK